ncbi:hypothetical protein DBR43_09815 [Pedobacter sp. KBW06]|nr:hypothetical protein DBR43_09815 [Pedobacter sp. KBW06]
MYLLFLRSSFKTKRNNGFVRKTPVDTLSPAGFINVGFDSWYFSGFDRDRFFLGNSVAPRSVLVIDTALTLTDSLKLLVRSDRMIAWRSMKLSVDYPHFYLTEGSSPHHFSGVLPDNSVREIPMPLRSFDKVIALSGTSLVFRTPDKKSNQNVLKKLRVDKPGNDVTHMLEKQVDGFFCTDGELLYDRPSGKMVYLYYYRNAFTVLDSNLKVLLKARTLDTVSRARLNLTEVTSRKKTSLASPPLLVNSRGCIYQHKLLVSSKLKADNEADKDFKQNFVMDIYNLNTGKYLHSLYLPKFGFKRISDLYIYRDFLYVCYGSFIYKFNLKLSHFGQA